MLTRPYGHIVGGCYIDDGRFGRVGVRDPYCDGKPVLVASKVDRECAVEMEEERGDAIFRG